MRQLFMKYNGVSQLDFKMNKNISNNKSMHYI